MNSPVRNSPPKQMSQNLWIHERTAGNDTRLRVFEKSDSGEAPRDIFSVGHDTHYQPQLPMTVKGRNVRSALSIEKGRDSNPEIKKPTILPKDHSLELHSIEANVGDQDTSRVFFQQLSEIGSIEGFNVIGYGKAESISETYNTLTESGLRNFDAHETPYSRLVWFEDNGEPTDDGGIVIPGQTKFTLVEKASAEGRRERGVSEDLPLQGQVAQSDSRVMAVAQAVASGRTFKEANSYIEGGNQLSGTRKDGSPYLVVGKDSIEITRQRVGEQSGREISEAEARAVIAEDYGLIADQVVGVEQPGEFHIDMRMTPIGPGEFALQDSQKVVEVRLPQLYEEYRSEKISKSTFEEQKLQLLKWGNRNSYYEQMAAEDLTNAGFVVHRMAGAFPDLTNTRPRDESNFFNARHGTNAEGERFSIMMGSSPEREEAFASELLTNLNAPIDRIYFTEPKATAQTLPLQGGLKCRTKTRGRVLREPSNSGDTIGASVTFSQQQELPLFSQ